MTTTDLWTTVNSNPDFFPTENQELLLHAALDDKPGALRAWEAWRSRVDIERLDTGSHRLLPLLYRNLLAHGVQDPEMARIKGVYRRTWYENQLLFNQLSTLLCSLRRAGIRTMVLKGAAVSSGYYRDSGVRPMDDYDVLVPYQDAFRSINLVRELGYRPVEQLTDIKAVVARRHAWDFADESGRHFDLHWNASYAFLGEDVDEDFWRQAVPVEVNGEETLMLCPTDQLLNVCAHGAKWNRIPPIRWVADAVTVFNRSGRELDWPRLLIQARRTRQTLALADTLKYLHDRFEVPVPPEVMEGLRRTRTTSLQRVTYRTLARSAEHRGLAEGLLHHYVEHVKGQRGASWWRRLLDFPLFLRKRWRLYHSGQIPGYIVSNTARRLWRRMSGT